MVPRIWGQLSYRTSNKLVIPISGYFKIKVLVITSATPYIGQIEIIRTESFL